VVGVVGVRLLWSGILVLRSSLWHLNFPREERARLVGRVVTFHYLLVAGTSAAVGTTVHRFPAALPWVYVGAALAALCGAALHRRVGELGRSRKNPLSSTRAYLPLAASNRSDGRGEDERTSLQGAWAIFLGDPGFRSYLLALLALDGGVLMAMAPLVLALRDVLRLDGLVQTALIATIPTLTVPLVASFFAAHLGRLHVLEFRARQGWLMASAALLFATGVSVQSVAALCVASVLLGLGYAGGSITWHVAHHEYATPHQSADYMVLNTLLTGIRGMIAPFCGVGLYRWAEAAQPGSGRLAIFAGAAVSLAGAASFVALAQGLRAEHRTGVGTVPAAAPEED
jgi:hypothetical protein